MRAVIMAGGEGKRLRPITCTMPKPMVPLLNRPVIDYCLELLQKHGVTDATATLHYLPNMIMQHCGDGAKYGLKLGYSIEDKPLGTAGSVKRATEGIEERTIVISGDAMTDVDITSAVRSHEKNAAAVTIILKKVDAPTEYGVALTRDDGRIYRFLEKPMLSEVFSDLANTGIYILEPEALQLIPKDRPFDFSRDLFPLMLESGARIFGYVTDKYWCDIGDAAHYLSAQRDMMDGLCAFRAGAVARDRVWIEEGARVADSAALMYPCYIASGAEIGENTIIADHTVIGSGARIGSGSSVKRSVIMENACVRENTEIRGAIICEGAEISRGASVFGGTVIGAGSRVGKDCTVKNGALVWPEKRLDDGESFCEHVKWEGCTQKPEDGGIFEYTDSALTPERAARMGAAFASGLSLPAEIAAATDGSQQANMLKYALLSGVVSQGADVLDMGISGLSAFGHGIREFGLAGGAYISAVKGEPHRARILLCDKTGTELGGGAFRSFSQELYFGARQPVTRERLGVVQRMTGALRAYDAHLARLTSIGGAASIIIGGDGEMYDAVARTLLPVGYNVRYFTGEPDGLAAAALHEQADAAFFADAEEGVLEAMAGEERLTEDRLTAALALAAIEDGRVKKLALPADMSAEYMRAISEAGAEVISAPSRLSRLARAAIEQATYIAELYEPEARMVRTAALIAAGRLKGLLKKLPPVEKSERTLSCSWRDVGRVFRSLVDTEKYENVELVDGVKVLSDDGWVLVRPNSGFTACRIIAGSFDAEYSRELADIYFDRVKSIATEGKNSR